MIGGVALVLLGAALAVAGSPVVAVVALVGVALFVVALMKTKRGDLAEARKEHAALTIKVAAGQESAGQFARERAKAGRLAARNSGCQWTPPLCEPWRRTLLAPRPLRSEVAFLSDVPRS